MIRASVIRHWIVQIYTLLQLNVLTLVSSLRIRAFPMVTPRAPSKTVPAPIVVVVPVIPAAVPIPMALDPNTKSSVAREGAT